MKANWLQKGELKPRYHLVRGLREPSRWRPLERIGDPQITLTRRKAKSLPYQERRSTSGFYPPFSLGAWSGQSFTLFWSEIPEHNPADLVGLSC